MIVQNSSQLIMLLAADESCTISDVKVRTNGPLFSKKLVDYLNKIQLAPEETESNEIPMLLPVLILFGSDGRPVFEAELTDTPLLPRLNPLPLLPEHSESNGAPVGHRTPIGLAPDGAVVSATELVGDLILPRLSPVALMPEHSESAGSPDAIDEVGHTERVERLARLAELVELNAGWISKDKTQRAPIRAGEPGPIIPLPVRQAVNPTLAVDAAVTENEVQKRSSDGVAEVARQIRIRQDASQVGTRYEADYTLDRDALQLGLRPKGAPISLSGTSAVEVLGLVLPRRELSVTPQLPSEIGDSSASPSLERPAVAILRSDTLRQDTIVLQLDPPDLGSLVVHIQRNPEQLHASFWAESAESRALLQSHLPALQEALTQLGLRAEQVTLRLISDDAFLHQFGAEFGRSFGQSSDQQNATFNSAQQHRGRAYSEVQGPSGFEELTPTKEGCERLVDIVI